MGNWKGALFIFVNFFLIFLGAIFGVFAKVFFVPESSSLFSWNRLMAGYSFYVLFAYLCFTLNYLMVRHDGKPSQMIGSTFAAFSVMVMYIFERM